MKERKKKEHRIFLCEFLHPKRNYSLVVERERDLIRARASSMDHRSTFTTTTTTTRDFAECILFCVGAFVVAFEREEDFYCERRFALRQNVRRTEKNEDEDPLL